MAGLAEVLDENTRLRKELAAMRAALTETQSELTETQSELTETQSELTETQSELTETQSELTETKGELALRDAKLEAVVREAEQLAQELELLRREKTGPRSQRFVPSHQALLPFSGEVAPPPRAPVFDAPTDAEETEAKPNRKKKRGGPRRRTRADVDHLPAREVHCKAAPATCGNCGGELQVFEQAQSFRVDWVPGHFEVHDILRDKCACPNCPGEGVLTAPGPYALNRCLAANGLIARQLVDKFGDHIPTNRQAKRMKREGFVVGTQTLSSWICKAADVLEPVAKAVWEELRQSAFLQGDDTGMPVQDAGNGSLRKGRMWAFTDQEQVVYAFSPTKAGEHPATLLAGFTGELLLVDGGSEFNQVVRDQGLERAGCWSHLRTYFFKALPNHPEEAGLALDTLRDLFLIERELWGKPPDEVLAGRTELSAPLVNGFFDWVRALAQITRPESVLGKALGYATNQEPAMRLFLKHGELPLHNNLSELMLRQTVVGRKNWLFARSEGGANAAATLYTLIGSCGLQGIDPWFYLRDVLDRVQDHPVSRIRELTPKYWQPRTHTAV